MREALTVPEQLFSCSAAGLMLLLFSRAAWVLSFRRSLIRTIPGAPADQDVWRAVVNHQVAR